MSKQVGLSNIGTRFLDDEVNLHNCIDTEIAQDTPFRRSEGYGIVSFVT